MKTNSEYTQVCVWPGTIIKPAEVKQFEAFFEENGFRVQFLESITTSPDLDEEGEPVVDTGGRTDVFFTIHNDDVMKFAIPRLQMGIRWIEDVLDNESHAQDHSIYPSHVKEYRAW